MKLICRTLSIILTVPLAIIGFLFLLIMLGLELPFVTEQDFDDFFESHPETTQFDYSDFDF